MKLLVVSDTHGRVNKLREVTELHKDADALIFLGDGLSDLFRSGAYDMGFTVFSLKGNCDVPFDEGRKAEDELCATLGGFKFFMLHGHTRDVKYSLDKAIYAARENNADVLLFGHTHMPIERYIDSGEEKPLRLFNPGSLGYDGSFGLVQIRKGSILFSHGRI